MDNGRDIALRCPWTAVFPHGQCAVPTRFMSTKRKGFILRILSPTVTIHFEQEETEETEKNLADIVFTSK
jgi:hypothetical protein